MSLRLEVGDEKALCLGGLPSPNPRPRSTPEKNTNFQQGTTHHIPTRVPGLWPSHQTQGQSERCHSREETGQLKVTRTGSRDRRVTSGEHRENLERVQTFTNSSAPVSGPPDTPTGEVSHRGRRRALGHSLHRLCSFPSLRLCSPEENPVRKEAGAVWWRVGPGGPGRH